MTIGKSFWLEFAIFVLLKKLNALVSAFFDVAEYQAEGEYRKYQVKTLSSVEKAYIETLKELNKIENKRKKK